MIDLLYSIFSDVAINCTTLQVTEQEAVLAIRNWLCHRKDKKKVMITLPPIPLNVF